MGGPSRRQVGSLGDSWDTPDYSDDNVSVHSVGSVSDTGSQSDYFERSGRDASDDEEDDMATPMPSKRNARTSQTWQTTPTKTSATRPPPRARNLPEVLSRSFQQTKLQQASEPAFIMPSLNASPLRSSQIRSRKTSRTSYQGQSRQNMPDLPTTARRRSVSQRGPFAQDQRKESESPWYLFKLLWDYFLRPVVGYAVDVFLILIDATKPIAGAALLVVALVLAFNVGAAFFKNVLQTSLSPLCALPFSGYIVPFCKSEPEGQADFEKLVKIQNSFEDILYNNKDAFALPTNMKKTQLAMRDLRLLVQFSNLPSKTELEAEFDMFILTAKEASEDLSRYNMRIGYVSDLVISTNHWTLQVLNEIAAEETTGALGGTFSPANIFSVFSSPPQSIKQRIFNQYVEHIAKIKEEIGNLIVFSESLMQLLNSIDTRLDFIAEVAMRDDKKLTRDRVQLLASLWSQMGGNQASKAESSASLELLRDVMRYRANAMQLVSSTLLKLREVSQGLENLREGIAAPGIAGYREDYPLEWHIDVVSRSVDRLRTARGESLAIEREVMRRGLDRMKPGETLLELDGGNMPTVHVKPT